MWSDKLDINSSGCVGLQDSQVIVNTKPLACITDKLDINSNIGVGIYYGFMTAFTISPGFIFVVHVGVLEKESQKQIATMTGFHYGTVRATHINLLSAASPTSIAKMEREISCKRISLHAHA